MTDRWDTTARRDAAAGRGRAGAAPRGDPRADAAVRAAGRWPRRRRAAPAAATRAATAARPPPAAAAARPRRPPAADVRARRRSRRPRDTPRASRS